MVAPMRADRAMALGLHEPSVMTTLAYPARHIDDELIARSHGIEYLALCGLATFTLFVGISTFAAHVNGWYSLVSRAAVGQ